MVHAFAGGRELTVGELCSRMPGVARVTMYRHIGALVEGGVLEVSAEQRVRGAVERRYRLRDARPRIGAAEAGSMTIEDHRRAFAAAMAVLIAEFNAYLDQDDADPVADSVGYRQGTIWLNETELADLAMRTAAALHPVLDNKPGPDRRPYLLSPIMFPAAGGPSDG